MKEKTEQERTRIEVLATDGESVKRVLWMSMNEKGISAGLCLRGQDDHYTYHSDGSRWVSRGENPTVQIDDGPPLNEVKGFLQFVGFVFPATLKGKHSVYSPYKRKKSTKRLDAVYFVDPSLFVHGGVACNIYLVEPHEAQDLARLPTRGVAHVFTQWKPWIAVVFSHVRMQ